MSSGSTFRKLTETELERQPEEVFDLVEEIGKGSYGTVHRAILKEDGELEVAIKKVILDSELHEIIKEIAIMQQCESPFVVRYYGSYFVKGVLYFLFYFLKFLSGRKLTPKPHS